MPMPPFMTSMSAGSELPHLVFLHALLLEYSMFRNQVEHRRAAGQSTRAYNLPGFGLSPHVEDEFTNYIYSGTDFDPDATIESMADALEHGIYTYPYSGIRNGGPIVLCGVGMGGSVALAFARRHPERLRGLILVNTDAQDASQKERDAYDKAILAVERHSVELLAEMLLPLLLGETTRRERPEVVEDVLYFASRQREKSVIVALRAMRDRPDEIGHLSQISVPTLVLRGAEDDFTPPAWAQLVAELIPNAIYQEIPAAGHLPSLEAPEAFSRVVYQFVQQIRDASGEPGTFPTR